MKWDEDLFEEQKIAASHIGTHARLLAGPGTGKTLALTRRVAYLIIEKEIPPDQILAITFTRAAAFELRSRIYEILKDQKIEMPTICTLHSFALRQLLRNKNLIESLPQPIRIADDWEMRNIICEDLKTILNCNLDTIKKRFNQLSADWETLTADEKDWSKKFVDPSFISAWEHHRKIFGYTLLSELVYQLKKSLEQIDDFILESDYSHLLIDEYQDLNHCDLAVIYTLRDKSIEIFVAGDDDQSIYGFRFAHPEGIRRFDKDFIPSKSFTLKTCIRCDQKIITLASFIAGLDEYRIPKELEHRSDAEEGEVQILKFKNQYNEAKGVALICKYLLSRENYNPNDILILMRSDSHKAFSSVVKNALEVLQIPAAVQVKFTPLEKKEGRKLLCLLHLFESNYDNLALKTLMMIGSYKIGPKRFLHIYDLARNRGEIFADTAHRVMENPDLIPKLGIRISKAMKEIQGVLNKYEDDFRSLEVSSDKEEFLNVLKKLADDIVQNREKRIEILNYLVRIIEISNSTNHKELLRTISSSLEDKEQELDSNSVNIMTMHRAKGLTKKAVIIIAAEDEYIPGIQSGEDIEDERRLLYVSLSRSKHFLIMTCCARRKGQQRHQGRTGGQLKRTLTRFLRNAPITPIDGEIYIEQLSKKE